MNGVMERIERVVEEMGRSSPPPPPPLFDKFFILNYKSPQEEKK